MIDLIARSGWTWDTSGTAGFSIDVLAMTGGLLQLKNPSRQVVPFHFGAIGAGLSTPGVKVPGLGKGIARMLSGRALNATGAPSALSNWGVVFKTAEVGGRELHRSDFTGPAIIADIGGSLPFIGIVGTAFLLGLDALDLAALASPAIGVVELAMGHVPGFRPKAVILSAGDSRGFVAGLNGYVGYVR